jgi:hypothetical protein
MYRSLTDQRSIAELAVYHKDMLLREYLREVALLLEDLFANRVDCLMMWGMDAGEMLSMVVFSQISFIVRDLCSSLHLSYVDVIYIIFVSLTNHLFCISLSRLSHLFSRIS